MNKLKELPIYDKENWKLERYKGVYDFYSNDTETTNQIIGHNSFKEKNWHFITKRLNTIIYEMEGIEITWDGNYFNFKANE